MTSPGPDAPVWQSICGPTTRAILLIGLAGFILAALWLRTGLVPAASTGDEVWWSEAGYQWLQDGVFRWDCLDDDRGSAIVSYWPPVIALLQAGCLWLFGLTAFGLMVQSSLIATLLMAATYLLTRNLGFTRLRALGTACAIFGLAMIERRLMQVRMENLTALCAITFVVLLSRPANTERPAGRTGFAAGLLLGVGLFSYYPQTPFLLLAAAGAAWCFRRRAIPGIVAGTAVVLAVGAIWIAPHWSLFRQQILQTGADHYLSTSHLLRPFTYLGADYPVLTRLQELEKWLVLGLGALALGRGHSVTVRGLGFMTLIGSLPMFVFDPDLQVFGGVFAVVLLFDPESPRWLGMAGRWQAPVCSALLLLAGARLGLTAFTGLYQYSSRDYRPVSAALAPLIPANSRVGISQEAWLALRSKVSASNLHLLVYAEMTIDQRPRVARNGQASDYFDFLVLRGDRLDALRRVYPWLGQALDQGRFRQIAAITQPPMPLPWAANASYELIVYQRTKPLPAPDQQPHGI